MLRDLANNSKINLTVMKSIWKHWQRIVGLLAVVLLCAGCKYAPSLSYNPWQTIHVPSEVNLLDIGFTPNGKHGWLVGADSTLLESTDEGETWKTISLSLDSDNYRFTSVSFSGEEGWIVGEPAIMLHTTDEGKSWEQIPLDKKLPGDPLKIVALGEKKAEMLTNVGAIYRTEDAGKTWKGLVSSAVGVIRTVERSPDGKYIAVSAKGNFYSTWEPGQSAWVQHNRNSSRRLQNMGFGKNGRLWLLARGGEVQFTNLKESEAISFSDLEEPDIWQEPIFPEFATSWGLLDLSYRTPEEIWISGGSGNLLCSFDGGQTWEKDQEVEDLPSNFYKIVFLTPKQGFVIGQRGLLLKYQEAPETV
jgi:photosystem II stability/assembly factor-like uncharacterized protein